MSKKKDNKGNRDLQKFHDMFQGMKEMMNNMDEGQKDFLRSLFVGKESMEDMLNDMFYYYQRPDYESMRSSHITWLAPFWNAKHDDNKLSRCGFVDEDGRNLSKTQKEEDIRGYLYTLFYHFTPNEDSNEWKLFGPLWLLEKYQMTNCLDIVLEVLRQDAHFYATYIWGMEECLSSVIFQLCEDQLDKLDSFLRETGLIPDGKPIVFDAIVMTAIHRPTKRLKALSIISSYLKYCHDICLQGANPANIERYAQTLATAHIREVMPQIRSMYEELELSHILYKGIEEVEQEMNDTTIPFHLEYNSLNDILLDLKDEKGAHNYSLMPYGDFGIDEEDDWEDEEDDWEDDEDDWEDEGDIIYDTDATCQCFTITATLSDAPQPVSRTLTVPSNIFLDSFTRLLMIAFGWKDAPDEYLYNNDDDTFMYGEDADYLLADVIWKKGHTAAFDILHNGKPLWRHTIVLEKVGKYREDTTEYIHLQKASGAYPNKSTKSMAEYVHRYASDKMRQPNLKKLEDDIFDFEFDYDPPM